MSADLLCHRLCLVSQRGLHRCTTPLSRSPLRAQRAPASANRSTRPVGNPPAGRRDGCESGFDRRSAVVCGKRTEEDSEGTIHELIDNAERRLGCSLLLPTVEATATLCFSNFSLGRLSGSPRPGGRLGVSLSSTP